MCGRMAGAPTRSRPPDAMPNGLPQRSSQRSTRCRSCCAASPRMATCSGLTARSSGGEDGVVAMPSGGIPLIHAGSEYSVVYDPNRGVYRMIATDIGVGPKIDEYTATADPSGPWTFAGTIDNTQTDGVYGSKPANDAGSPCTLTTYGAKEQPAFESNGDIVFTYNVNVTGCSAADAETAYEASVANYDPVFMYG